MSTSVIQWQPSQFYVAPLASTATELKCDLNSGLQEGIAEERLRQDGPNAIGKQTELSAFRILIDQIRSTVVVLLLAAAIISALLNEYLQTIGIIVAVFINAGVGFVTEYQAKISLEKLAKLAGSSARVRRGNVELLIPVTDLVRGDLLLLQPGDRIPADARITDAAALSVDESVLTGESVPVWKDARAKDQSFEQQTLFQGTVVCSGRARAIVIATGTNTRLGALAGTIDTIETSATPLQIELEHLGKVLTVLTVMVCAVVAIAGLILSRHQPLHLLQTAVALAVAAIPEGLPVVSTLALAIGITRMVHKRALVRRLTAVETLGCTTVICTDKTGTLTENKMSVSRIITADNSYSVTGSGYEPLGKVAGDNEDTAGSRAVLDQLLKCAALCNDAVLQQADGEWKVIGDPTEGALIVAARKIGLEERNLGLRSPRITEFPFDLDRKRMSTIHGTAGGVVELLCKGSPESVLAKCTHFLNEGARCDLTNAQRQWFEQQNSRFAEQGLRVLAVAKREFNEKTICIDQISLEQDLTLLGLVAMADTLRSGVKEAIDECRAAGIRVLMLTGDQERTAAAIAGQLGIARADVMARVTPEMKLSIVQNLQNESQIVAMTGDGVNDAPALKQSNIGIAMGKSGSDLARDAADLVITDDNFATIIGAIEEGRAIYRNIKRAVAYLLTASLASVFVVSIGVLFSKDLLLSPLQLLWLNLIMHVFPGLGIVMQRDTKQAMSSPPRAQDEHLITPLITIHILIRAAIVSVVTLGCAYVAAQLGFAGNSTSLALTTISFCLLLQSWSWLFDASIDGRPGKPLASLLTNIPMWGNTIIGVILAMFAVYFGPLQPALETSNLRPEELALAAGLALATFALTSVLLTPGLPCKGNPARVDSSSIRC